MSRPQLSGWRRLRDRFQTYLRLHAYALFSSLGELWRHPWMTFMTLLVIAVTLALPLTFYLTLKNLQGLSGGFENSWQVSLYLHPQLEVADAGELVRQLKKHEAIESVTLVDKASALAEFRRYSGFGEVLDTLGENPLPVVIEVLPRPKWATPKGLTSLVKTWEKLPEVDYVQWDMQWLQRLRGWLQLAQRGVLLLGGLLSLTVLLVVGNIIRLELQNRHEEIEIMRLLGATNGFIRRPFLYSGFWYGITGGLLACGLVLGLYLVLRPDVVKLAVLYGSAFNADFASPREILLYLGISIVLGMTGAWLVVTRHLWLIRM